MSEGNPSILNHVSVGVNNLDDALEFYDAVMAAIGASRQLEISNVAVAYGTNYPEFWVQRPLNGAAATCANGGHFALTAPTKEAVKAFYDAALDNGGTSDGQPGPRPMYGPTYYACFVYDPDGHKIEANWMG